MPDSEIYKTPEFEKITKARMPFDMRSDDPKKNYGIHSLDIWFILKGPKGAVQFAVNFPVDLPHVEEEFKNFDLRKKYPPRIRGFDVGYHSPKPMYESQSSMEECDFLDEGKCYYDGSSLRAEKWAKEIFSIRGSHPEDEIWRRLENEYKMRFDKNGDE